jgi:hypothetical protein
MGLATCYLSFRQGSKPLWLIARFTAEAAYHLREGGLSDD